MKKTILFLLISLSASFSFQKPTRQTHEYYRPKVGDTFEWRLDSIGLEEVNQYSCSMIDIDAFSATKELVDAFHARGIKVVAYVSVGTFENYRPDLHLLPPEIIGKKYRAWPDEHFLDIRQIDPLKPFFESRFDMIKAKGFDGIEADNIDTYGLKTGFDLTLNDEKIFCEYLIEEAHKRGLSIGQKNAEELVPLLYHKFDWALTESAFKQNHENNYQHYIASGKPVFSAEYKDEMSSEEFKRTICPRASALKYYAFLKQRDLNKWRMNCE